jgi:hypothetical protein
MMVAEPLVTVRVHGKPEDAVATRETDWPTTTEPGFEKVIDCGNLEMKEAVIDLSLVIWTMMGFAVSETSPENMKKREVEPGVADSETQEPAS